MKKRFISLFVLAFVFTFNLSVLADEGHDDVKKSTGTHSEESDSHGDAAESHTKKSDIHSDAAKTHEKEADAHPEDADVHAEAADAHEDAAKAHSDAGDAHGEEKDLHDKESGTHSEEKEAHGDEAGADDHHGPVVETPPNYKVLGTYGAVNLSFILIGVWNKWFRRKGIK